MIENNNQNDLSVEQRSYESDSSSNSQIVKHKNPIAKSKLLMCLKRYFKKLNLKIYRLFSRLTILCQYLIFVIPLSALMWFILVVIHYHAFEKVIKFDFFSAIKNLYLNFLTVDLDDLHFDLGSLEVKSSFEELEGFYFFRIYFKELISMGLLNETSKIYPNISDYSETLYESLDLFQNEIQMSSFYSIPKDYSKKYIDDRKDGFSEIAKLYYHYFPTISFELYNRELYINQSFLIMYEFDNNTYNINNDYLYFSFPRFIYEGSEQISNFFPFNSHISPTISKKNNVTHGKKENDTFYNENWFIKQDYDFRVLSSKENSNKISIIHLNHNYFGQLNKSNIISIQNYETFNNKHYIINYVVFINQNSLKQESFDYSTFLIFNNSCKLKLEEREKYSDNQTYLIFKSNIIELTLSANLSKYFHYGMYDKNNNFYKNAISFDSFDIENLGEPSNYYNTTENFNIDLRYFSSLYLYTFLFINSEFNQSINDNSEQIQMNFEEKNNLTKNICSVYNYSSYIEYLENQQIKCNNIQNMQYYSQKKVLRTKPLYNYIFMPYCICLPLYCLKEDTKFSEFADNITLPDRCQNYYKFYDNGINKKNKDIILNINEKINFFTNKLKDKLEDEYFIYKYMKFSNIPGIYFLIVNFVDNYILNDLLNYLIEEIEILQFHFDVGITFFYFILICVINNILIHNIKKLSQVIFEYQKKHEHFLYQSSLDNIDNEKTEKQLNSYYYSNKIDIIFNGADNSPLLKNENENNDYSSNNDIFNDNMLSNNILLEDLVKIFNKYYNVSAEKIIKKYKKAKDSILYKNRINIIEEKNELFKLLSILSLNAPKFKLNISLDFNFYMNSKLNENFIKFIVKSQLIQSQQILLTQSVIYEILSTENIEDYGLIENLNFKYISNVSILSKTENSIKKSMFNLAKNEIKYDKKNESTNPELNNFKKENKGQTNINKSTDNDIINEIEIIWKERNFLMDDFESNFENDDFIKRDKLEQNFDYFLINVYLKYIKKINTISENSANNKDI